MNDWQKVNLYRSLEWQENIFFCYMPPFIHIDEIWMYFGFQNKDPHHWPTVILWAKIGVISKRWINIGCFIKNNAFEYSRGVFYNNCKIFRCIFQYSLQTMIAFLKKSTIFCCRVKRKVFLNKGPVCYQRCLWHI